MLTPLNLDLQSPHFGTDPFFFTYKYTSRPPGVLELCTVNHGSTRREQIIISCSGQLHGPSSKETLYQTYITNHKSFIDIPCRNLLQSLCIYYHAIQTKMNMSLALHSSPVGLRVVREPPTVSQSVNHLIHIQIRMHIYKPPHKDLRTNRILMDTTGMHTLTLPSRPTQPCVEKKIQDLCACVLGSRFE